MDRRTCPKCGGTAGYFYRLVVVYDQWVEWDGKTGVSADNVPDSRSTDGKIGKCQDCGYRFKISRLAQSEEKVNG